MKLANVFGAVGSWQKLSGIPMKPSIAYKVLKYMQLIDAEYAAVEKQRVAILTEIANAGPGEPVSITPNTPEFTEFQRRFSEVLVVDCELGPCPLEFNEIIGAAEEADGKLSVSDLAALEPFFVKE